jgi:hypothetical protein
MLTLRVSVRSLVGAERPPDAGEEGETAELSEGTHGTSHPSGPRWWRSYLRCSHLPPAMVLSLILIRRATPIATTPSKTRIMQTGLSAGSFIDYQEYEMLLTNMPNSCAIGPDTAAPPSAPTSLLHRPPAVVSAGIWETLCAHSVLSPTSRHAKGRIDAPGRHRRRAGAGLHP